MKFKAVSGITLTLLLTGMLMLAESVKANPQLLATTKLSISPTSVIGPPPGIDESFTVDIYIENVTDLNGWIMGVKWDPAVLNCTSFTVVTGTGTFLGPVGDWLYMEPSINNTVGWIEPPATASLTAGKTPRTGSGTMAQVEFLVLDYGFTWINLTWVIIKVAPGYTPIPVDIVNGSFTLFPSSAPLASFTYSPSAPKVDEQVKFNASASVPGWNGTAYVPIANYTWNFGDGTTGTGIITTHTYTNPGTYAVTLTVKDVAGNTDIHTVTVTVLSEEEFPMWIVVAAAIVAVGIAIATVVFMKLKRKKQ